MKEPSEFVSHYSMALKALDSVVNDARLIGRNKRIYPICFWREWPPFRLYWGVANKGNYLIITVGSETCNSIHV